MVDFHRPGHIYVYFIIAPQAIWVLGNIAGDDVQLRDFVLDNGILDPLLSLVSSN